MICFGRYAFLCAVKVCVEVMTSNKKEWPCIRQRHLIFYLIDGAVGVVVPNWITADYDRLKL